MSYGGLLRWAFSDVYPAIQPHQQTAMIGQAEQLQEPSCLRQVECGLEFHHDGSDRVDLGFHCQSRLVNLGAIAVPPWWPALVRASDPPDATEFFGDAAAGLPVAAERAAHREPPPMRFHGRHWLEFDQRGDGRLRLAGLFQHCEAARPRDPHAYHQLLGHFRSIGCLPSHDLRHSKAAQLVFDAFGVPFQWGFMVGRAEGLKLVATLDGIEADRLEAFCGQAALQPALGDRSELVRWCRAIADPPPHLQFAISLDLNLLDDGFAPSIGVEVYGPPSADSVSAWSALEPMLDRFQVESAAVASVRRALQPLPTGQREQLRYGGLEAFLAEELRAQRRIASHNHVKLVFRQGQRPAVKSYMSLRLQRGPAAGS